MGENSEKFFRAERQDKPTLNKKDVDELTRTLENLTRFRLDVRNQILSLKQKIDASSEEYKKIQAATKGWPEEISTEDLMNLLQQGNDAWKSKSSENRHLNESMRSVRYRGSQLSDKLLDKIREHGGEKLNQFINNQSQTGFVSQNFGSDPIKLFFLINDMEGVVGRLISPYKFSTKKE